MTRVPDSPGAYLLKDERGRVIYVGKSRNLKERLKAHLANSSETNPRLAVLKRRLRDFEFITTTSEIEALILEANLIKLHLPKYNVRLKDDKKYPYIKVTLNEDYPRVFPTRNLEKNGWIFFGPYTNVRSMKKALRAVKKIFPIRSCRHKLPSNKNIKPCLNYYIKKCCAPCQGYLSKEDYRKLVDEVCKFLCGKNKMIEEDLEQRMGKASGALRFEEAAHLRDQLRAVREIVRKQRVAFEDQIDRDVLGLVRGYKESCIVVLQIRDGKLVGQEHYILSAQKNIEEGEVIGAFLKHYYRNAYFVPDEVILPRKAEDTRLISEWLTSKKKKKVRVLVPQKGTKMRILDIAKRNALYLFQEEKPRSNKREVPFSVRELQRVLSLQKPPRTIDALDISNLYGTNPCGSLVVFKDGKPEKRNYKKFRIKSVEGIDDYAMMRELVHRRYRKVIEQEMKLPDLILIDGGIGQLNSARKVLEEMGKPDIAVLGLAKRLDEIVLPGGSVIMLPRSSHALRLLQRLRDEAHRFAVGYHRKLREKKFKHSLLDDIPGVGKERKVELIRYFGSLERIREATPEEMNKVRGVGKVLASRIHSYLHRQ